MRMNPVRSRGQVYQIVSYTKAMSFFTNLTTGGKTATPVPYF